MIWRPGNGKRPRRIQSKWYVADTPGPAILGLPTCESLQVITLNCAVCITHNSPVTLGKKEQQKEQPKTSPKPTVNAEKQPTDSPVLLMKPPPNPSGKIHTKEQLIEEYPDCFKGIGRFPGTHKIHLQDGAKPVIHPQQKWPIAMHDKLKAKLDQMEKDEIITQVTEPTDWVNSLACLWKPDGDL